MARPTKYTVERAAKLIQGLKAGMTISAAASLIDVDVTTVANWAKRYSIFSQQLDQAQSEAEARYTDVIAKAAFGQEVKKTTRTTDANGMVKEVTETYREYDWQAAKYWLSRRRRKDWGDSLHVDLDAEIKQLLSQIAGVEEPDADIATTD